MPEKEQSAIDAIYQILDKLASLEKQVKVIDSNIKLLNNKIGKLQKVAEEKPAHSKATAIAPPPPADSTSEPLPPSEIETIKTFGRIKNKNHDPIKGVEVKVYTPSGELIKSRLTDSDGYWEARILPGIYGIEYDPSKINARLKPVNFNISLKPGIKEFDVSPPQK